jgi:hypothetical protein
MGPDIGNVIFFNKAKFNLLSKYEIEFEKVLWNECKKDLATRAMLAYGHPQVSFLFLFSFFPFLFLCHGRLR